MSLPLPIEVSVLHFTLGILCSEIQHEETNFEKLDRLYSEFFYLQNDHVRFLYRLGDITVEERDHQWAEVDAQESEWQARLDEWGVDRFYLSKSLSEIRARLRELQKSGEVSRVAA